MATASTPGTPAISNIRPNDWRAVQQAISSIIQRFMNLEAALATTTGTATTTANSSNANLNSILNQLSVINQEITNLQNAQSTDIESFVAGEAIAAGQVVVPISANTVGVADPNDTARIFGVLGVATGPAAPASAVLVQRKGVFTFATGMGFEVGRAVYCDTVGGVTQMPSYDAVTIPLGVAVSANAVFVDPDSPALLQPTFSSGFENVFEDYLPATYALIKQFGSLESLIAALPYQSGADLLMEVPVLTDAGNVAVRVTVGDIVALATGGGLTPIAAGDLLANLTGSPAIPIGHTFSEILATVPFNSGSPPHNALVLVDIGGVAALVDISTIVGGVSAVTASAGVKSSGGTAPNLTLDLSSLSTQSGIERFALIPALIGSNDVLVTAEDIASLANLQALIAALPYSSGVAAGALVPVEIGGVAVTVTAEDIAALAPVPSTLVVFNTQTASYALVASDMDNLHWVEMNVASANNLTVPTNATVPAPIGTTILFSQLGAGQTTVVAAVGVTLLFSSTLKTRAQDSTGGMTKKATDIWYVFGDLV